MLNFQKSAFSPNTFTLISLLKLDLRKYLKKQEKTKENFKPLKRQTTVFSFNK